MSSLRRAGPWVVQVLMWTVVATVVVVLAVAVALPRLTGATPYTVLTGSMRPDLGPGTLVVVRPVDVDDLSVGDVITYQLRSGEPEVVTHRIVQVATTLEGERRFTTRGDANGADDAEPVRAEQIKGRLWYDVPHLGRVSNVLDGGQREVITLVLGAALAGYAVLMFAGALRDRGRGRHVRTEVSP